MSVFPTATHFSKDQAEVQVPLTRLLGLAFIRREVERGAVKRRIKGEEGAYEPKNAPHPEERGSKSVTINQESEPVMCIAVMSTY